MHAVSVIMATNRVDAYLNQAVTSVLSSVGVDVELVLVLDGVDLSAADPAWATDSRITQVTLPTSNGLAAALNEGVRAAAYDIIARLDADDNAYPDRFRLQVEALTGPTAPILVGARTVLIDEHGNRIGSPQQPCGPDIRSHLLLQNVVPHSTYLLRKADAIAVGLYNSELRQMEDYDFLLRLGQHGAISMLCEPLVEYRVHSGQMSKKADWRANYITAVTQGRRALGRHLGASALEISMKNAVWRFAQILRSMRIIKPRHLVGVQRSESVSS